MLNILFALLILSILVVVHEAGHCFAGKKLGIQVDEFAVGMGPKLASKQWGDTLYTLRAIPIGGFTRFDDEGERGFSKATVWRRMLTILSGPVANILLAFIVAFCFMFLFGNFMPSVGEMIENSPAQQSGLQEGDIITEIAGNKITFYAQTTRYFAEIGDQPFTLHVLRDGKPLSFTLQKQPIGEDGALIVGLTYPPVGVKLGFFESWVKGVQWCFAIVYELFYVIVSIFKGTLAASEALSGPVGTISTIGQTVSYGWFAILQMSAMLSMNLAVINLLPIPSLDGSRMIFLAIEWIRGKPIDPEKEGMVHLVGMALLILLAIYLTIGDVARL